MINQEKGIPLQLDIFTIVVHFKMTQFLHFLLISFKYQKANVCNNPKIIAYLAENRALN